jgi:poly(A) polymerase
VQDLENTDMIITAHPLIYGISKPFFCLTDEEQAAASQGELSETAMQRTEEDMAGKDFKKVWTKSFFVGLEIEKKPSESVPCTCEISVLMAPAEDTSGSRVLNLFYASKRFCSACQGWDKYDEMEMSVILRPAKRYV